MTTKETERKALEQIRKIVEGLGENSYIGTAFEGCFEDAEENIENDFACSMKQRKEAAEAANDELKKKIAALEWKIKTDSDHMECQRIELEEKDKAMTTRGDRIEALSKQLNEACDKAVEHEATILEIKEREQQYKMEILELKAKLYDLMVK